MQPTPAVDTLITPLFKKTRKRPAQYIVNIDLLDAPLSIHRRLSIPSNMNLGYVQEILMLAMGWQGHHLKEITYGNVTYTTRYAGGQNPAPMDEFPQKDSYKHTLGDLLKTEEDSLLFKYDLGHRLTQARINDFQRTIGEARWGFYRK